MKRKQTYSVEMHRPPHGTAAVTVVTAVSIATKYATRVPEVDELIAEYGMSRPTAYRWRAAFRCARGVA